MAHKTQEIMNYTREQVVGHFDEALAIITELELDDDLRVPAFLKAVDLLCAKQLIVEQINPGILGGMAIPRGG